MEIMWLIIFIGWSTKISGTLAMNCQEEMNYHETYGYGYDIWCKNLHNDNIAELRNITVYNEVALTVRNSNLNNISTDLFRNILKLREITITQSNVNLKNSFRPFENLGRLELLSISDNNITQVPQDVFAGLFKLRVLNASNNNISVLQKGTLKNIECLKELDLSQNNFERLNDINLCEASQLRHLYLRHNFLNIANSSIGCLKLLKTLALDFNRIIDLRSFSTLQHLIRISLSYNYVNDLNTAFEGFQNLQELNLEGNKITNIGAYSLKNVPYLKNLNLKNNLINSITLENLTSLEELNLHTNNLSVIKFVRLNSLQKLDLSNNNNTMIRDNIFSQIPNLKSLSLSNCNIKELSMGTFQSLTKLDSLDLSYNNLILTNFCLSGVDALSQLNLRGNSFLEFPNAFFKFLPKLKILDISNNKLKEVGIESFSNLKSLENLNLSYNKLEIIREEVLDPLKNLKTLDLEGNRLKYIDYHTMILTLPYLKLINIRENQLSCEFLSKMLDYFHVKNINYSINAKLSYDEENVSGIHCKEFNESFKRNEEILMNGTTILNKLNTITTSDSTNMKAGFNPTLLLLSLVVLILVFSGVLICYRVYVALKRRRAMPDVIELLDARIDKWSN